MKSRFTTIDIYGIIVELQKRLLGFRVINVYDIDNKTYLFKLAKPSAEEKAVLLMEAGIRLHTTDFEWPKNPAPSGFSMKMRKHIKNKRIEIIKQLGIDRIVDIQFGSGECAYHVIVELYDRGNLFLTDHEYTILHLLRPRTDTDQDVKYATRERYPVELARQPELQSDDSPTGLTEAWSKALNAAKDGDQLRRILTPHFDYGPAVLEHCLLEVNLNPSLKLGRDFPRDDPQIRSQLAEALGRVASLVAEVKARSNAIPDQVDSEKLLSQDAERTKIESVSEPPLSGGSIQGIITYRVEEGAGSSVQEAGALPDPDEQSIQYLEFHPYIYSQCRTKQFLEFSSFNKAIDEFFSKMESQKVEMKTVQKEKAALKKLENIRKDHEKRVNDLQTHQESDKKKAQMIELNQSLVDAAILSINHALASQVDWDAISQFVAEAKEQGDPIASLVTKLKLDINHITLTLKDPYQATESDDEDAVLPDLTIDIDLGLTAFANAKKYYDMKRGAAIKEQKTISSSVKALKSAEVKTKQMLKDVQTIAKINKVRKTMWFEKFHWFISSENYLVVAGRDSQQNEMLVKRYFRPGDVYVHADLHGASTVIVKNHKYVTEPNLDAGSGPGLPPPKTLVEAGHMAVAYSSAWGARVVTAAWWVTHGQVTKTAPSGEYLTAGSFMIRGKKNYLPAAHLLYGFGFLFKLDEESIPMHKGERRVRTLDEIGAPEEGADMKSDPVEGEASGEEESEGSSSESGGDEGRDSGLDEEEGENVFANASIKIDLSAAPKTAETKSRVRISSSCIKEEPEFPNPTSDTIDAHPNAAFGLNRQSSVTSSQGSGGGKKHLSAKERRDLRKQKNRIQDPSQSISNKEDTEDREVDDVQQEDKRESRVDMEADSEEDDNFQSDSVAPCSIQVKQEAESKSKSKFPVKRDLHQGSNKENHKTNAEQQQVSQQPMKRRQKNKMKKMKEKYKDQDEEDREIRMAFLQSDGSKKEEALAALNNQKKGGKKGGSNNAPKSAAVSGQGRGRGANRPKSAPGGDQNKPSNVISDHLTPVKEVPISDKPDPGVEEDAGEDVDVEEGSKDVRGEDNTSDDVLDSLTGCPREEDILLYAIPVCAPYQTLLSYKFKVKMTPGNTKRGKATKTVLGAFMADKTSTGREKDLLRILKDQDLSRNFPGKVKISVPAHFKSNKK